MAHSHVAVGVVTFLAASVSHPQTATSSGEAPCPTPGVVETLGVPTLGAPGALHLGLSGAPLEGLPIGFRVSNSLPLAHGCFFYGTESSPMSLPQYGATSFPALPVFVDPFQADESGTSPSLVSLDQVPASLCGLTFVVQAIAVDPAATGGLAFTHAFSLTVGGDASGPLLPGSQIPFDQEPQRTLVGDFDGDGAPDLAITRNGLTILQGNGDGTLAPSMSIEVGEEPAGLAAGDIDRDGHVDLLVTNAATFSLDLLLGDGAGTFGSPISFAVAAYPMDVVLGELDGDQMTDVVTVNALADSITILENRILD